MLLSVLMSWMFVGMQMAWRTVKTQTVVLISRVVRAFTVASLLIRWRSCYVNNLQAPVRRSTTEWDSLSKMRVFRATLHWALSTRREFLPRFKTSTKMTDLIEARKYVYTRITRVCCCDLDLDPMSDLDVRTWPGYSKDVPVRTGSKTWNFLGQCF